MSANIETRPNKHYLRAETIVQRYVNYCESRTGISLKKSEIERLVLSTMATIKARELRRYAGAHRLRYMHSRGEAGQLMRQSARPLYARKIVEQQAYGL